MTEPLTAEEINRYSVISREITKMYHNLLNLHNTRMSLSSSLAVKHLEKNIEDTRSKLQTLLEEEAKYVGRLLDSQLLRPIDAGRQTSSRVEELASTYGGRRK